MTFMGDIGFRRLGDSGLMVSVVGLGCNNFGMWDSSGTCVDADTARAVVAAALDVGINLFDTAEIYGGEGRSEEALGAALKGCRDEVVIATKFGHYDMGGPPWGFRGSRRYIIRAVEASLRRLDTDYIDLYQIHYPDPDTPLEVTMAAMDDLVGAGKVRYLGHCNFAGWQVADAAWIARRHRLTPFVSAQNHYSLLHREVEAELVPACQHYGVGLLPYFPLASGLLTGKYRRGAAAPEGTRMTIKRFAPRLASAPWDTIEALQRYAEQRGRSMLEVAVGWLAAQPTTASVIAGATSPDQVRANAAAGGWEPSADDLATLDQLTRPARP
jgi:aryl-alcohol dehydrogenase-like predicted oxidoreductase